MAQTERPRQRRKEARPGEIIEAGLAEFGARGFEGTRMEDVAHRAGIAKGTIFRYFPNKEALFEAAVQSRLRPVFEEVTAALETWPGSSEDLLRLMIGRVYARLAQSDLPVLMRIIIAEGPRFPSILDSYYRGAVQRAVDVLGRIIARGVASGEFRAGPVAELPMLLMAPALMAAVWKLTFHAQAPIPPERFMAAHLDLILNGLCRPTAESMRRTGWSGDSTGRM